MDTFDEFVVVNEKSFTDLFITFACNRDDNDIKFSDVSQFAALEFRFNYRTRILEITDIGKVSGLNLTLAQIIRWEWAEKGEQQIKEIKLLKFGGSVQLIDLWKLCSIVVRILKKKDNSQSAEDPFQSLISPDDDLTVEIGDKQVVLSAARLRCFSPMVDRMLSVEMREKQQRSITLNELGIDMEQFLDFFANISPNALSQPILPNPKNVLTLLSLANFFQVDWLKSRCEAHLFNCVEIPLIDRVNLSEKYQLTNFKNFVLNLNVDKLRAFFKENHEHLMTTISKEFLSELIKRICG